MMEIYHKINAPFRRDMNGSLTGVKGKLIIGDWALPEFAYLADCEWEYTEKVDGTNIRVGLYRQPGDNVTAVEIGGRTDNAVIPDPLMWALHGLFTDASANAKVTEWMQRNDIQDVVLFGEGYGPKIQGGGKYRSDHSFVLFDVKVGRWWLDRAGVNDVAANLGLDSVPVLGTGTLWDAIDGVSSDGHEIFTDGTNLPRNSYVDGLLSNWGDFEAEGIVARPVVPLFNRKGDRIITKIKAKDFR